MSSPESDLVPALAQAREAFLGMVESIRPELHRYCARLTGSVIEGEDIVQESLAKAFYALSLATETPPLRPWLFRIAHNAAIDFLKSHGRRLVEARAELDDVPAEVDERPDPAVVRLALARFLALPLLQRSAVILKDVLGHSLEEVASITGASEAAAKSALQRGRVRLREFAKEPAHVSLPMLSDGMRARLTTYVEGFKIGDFDTVRAMLADDVKLDLVAKLRKRGKSEVGEYYNAYEASKRWAYAAGIADGRAAMIVYDREVSLLTPAYFVALAFEGDRLVSIHDFLYARYAMDGIDLYLLSLATGFQ